MEGLYIKKEVIDYYMGLKGIKKYTALLKLIGTELGYKEKTLYDFPKSAKGNFSKMLKGERPLNTDYIIPLEKIFGVSLARMLEPDKFNYQLDKEEVIFIKGLRYYAYKDDPNLYENELIKLYNKEEKPIITSCDEFGKYFLDYVVEYNSTNAIKFLHKTYNIKLKWYHNLFETNNRDKTSMSFSNTIYLARMIANMNDPELFFDIYDTYNMFITNRHYANGIYDKEEFINIILDSNLLFESLFKPKKYEFKLTEIMKKSFNQDTLIIESINPITNNCLKYALNNLDKYKEQAIKILKYGIDNNLDVFVKVDNTKYCRPKDELGGMWDQNNNFYGYIIFTSEITKDDEINQLINKLPKYVLKY